MRHFLILTMLWLPVTVHAQQVHKCPGKDGVPSYQSDPCPGGQASKTWDARPLPLSPADQARIDRQRTEAVIAQQQRRAAANAPAATVHRGPTESQQREARCNAARRERDAYFERRGLQRTFEELRRWDDYVRERCK